MSNTNLNITVIERRLLKLRDAASNTGLTTKTFKSLCPVAPVEICAGFLLWDKRDLDQWIDSIRSGVLDFTHEAILRKMK